MSSEDPWKEDLLGRKPEADLLHKYLCSVSQRSNHPHGHKSFVLNLKSEWGSGKTFFLKSFAQQLTDQGHVVANIDIWRSDQELDPLVSIVAGCRDAIREFVPRSSKVGRTLKSATNNAGKVLALTSAGLAKRTFIKMLGVEFEDLVDNLNLGVDEEVEDHFSDAMEASIQENMSKFDIANYFDRQLSSVQARNLAVKAFNRDLENVLQSLATAEKIKLPMFVLVDELDRCRPTYAISVLERINHLFDIEGLIFIIGTDTDQLAHAVNAVYGPSFSSKEYLDRFFSQTYKLRSLSLRQAIESTVSEYEIDSEKFAPVPHRKTLDVMKEVITQTSPNMRHAKKVLNMIAAFSSLWERPEKIDEVYLTACALAVVNQDEVWLKSQPGVDLDRSETSKKLARTSVFIPRHPTDTESVNAVDYCRTFREAGSHPFVHTQRKEPGRNAVVMRVQKLISVEQHIQENSEQPRTGMPSWGGYTEGLLSLNNFIV